MKKKDGPEKEKVSSRTNMILSVNIIFSCPLLLGNIIKIKRGGKNILHLDGRLRKIKNFVFLKDMMNCAQYDQ